MFARANNIDTICPSTQPCYAAATASKLLYFLIVHKTLLASFNEAKMASHSLAALAVAVSGVLAAAVLAQLGMAAQQRPWLWAQGAACLAC